MALNKYLNNNESYVSTGGDGTVPIAAGTATDTVVKAAAGRLCRVVLQAPVATNAIQIFDNASTHTGTVLAFFPVGQAAGNYDISMPAFNGITVQGNATNVAMTVSFL